MKRTDRISRRQFIGRVAAGAAAAAVGPALVASAGPTTAPDAPNILVIMSDEHNAGVLGCYGNTIIRTPNLDALAGRGVLFENCYTNSPLCVPSRLSFTSGKYASRVNAWGNSAWLPSPDYPSLPRLLNGVGYESYLCGKMHYDESHRYGFTEIGFNSNTSYMRGLGGRKSPDATGGYPGVSSTIRSAKAGDSSPVLDHDRKVTGGVLDFLAARKPGDKPFFLLAGYVAPHFPLVVPQAYLDAYKGKVPPPAIPEGYLDTLPLNYKVLRAHFQVQAVPEPAAALAREAYYGLTQWVDEEIGKVLTALAASPLGDNTVVIYTSDHGENLGEHGMWWKNCMFDSAARVPLIVAYPKLWKGGQQRVGVCSLLDVVQTIAQVGGAKPPADWNGASLAACLDDPAAPGKDQAVSEYYANGIASGFAMIRQGPFKYVYHTPPDDKHPAQRELYNLKEDPRELKNLADQPDQADRLARMHAALVAEIGEEPDKTEGRFRTGYQTGYGRPPRPTTQKASDSD